MEWAFEANRAFRRPNYAVRAVLADPWEHGLSAGAAAAAEGGLRQLQLPAQIGV